MIIDPTREETYRQADAMLQTPHCVGIKIHPEEHVYPFAEHGHQIFEFAAERNAVILTHSGHQHSLPADIVPVANAFPEVQVILAHIGCSDTSDRTLQVRAIQQSTQGNVYADTSSAMSITPRLIEWAVGEVGCRAGAVRDRHTPVRHQYAARPHRPGRHRRPPQTVDPARQRGGSVGSLPSCRDDRPMTSGLHWIDGLILAGYACSMVYLGWWHSRGQQTTDEYFVGNRGMNPILIGISLFATLFSTISYLTSPGEVLRHGPVVPLIGILTIPFFYYIVGHLMAPIYMRHRSTSAYALLESQLGLSCRLLGASMFVLLRLMWMSVLIYMACQALLVMLAWDEDWLPYVAFATGGIAIFYASMGWSAGRRDHRHVSIYAAVLRRLAGDRHGHLGRRRF